jgi:hypothetical protein
MVQRAKGERLAPERWRRLNDLGFVWDRWETVWEEGIHFLNCFQARNGHCRVPYHHKENGYPLGHWVHKLRTTKHRLTSERRRYLDRIDISLEQLDHDWEEGFEALERYHARESDCRVPHLHQENGYPLGQWVITQRAGRTSLSGQQRRRLDALGFTWRIASALPRS